MMKMFAVFAALCLALVLNSHVWAQQRATTDELPAALLALNANPELILSTSEASEIRGEGGFFGFPGFKPFGFGFGFGFHSPAINVVGEKNKVDIKGGWLWFGAPTINIYGVKNKVKLK